VQGNAHPQGRLKGRDEDTGEKQHVWYNKGLDGVRHEGVREDPLFIELRSIGGMNPNGHKGGTKRGLGGLEHTLFSF